MIQKKGRKDQASLGLLLLALAIIIVVHWTLVPESSQSAFVWGVVDAAFITMPFFYFFTICRTGNKKNKYKDLDYSLLIPFVVLAVLAAYQLLTGQFAINGPLWDYIDALAVVSYSFAAGKMLQHFPSLLTKI